MKSLKRALLYGILIWLIPFIVSFFIYPIKISLPALFESIMPIIITISVVAFSNLYFKRVGEAFLREGVLLGIIWFVISLVLDLLMFIEGPMKMIFSDYMIDIGLTYLIIPVITIGSGQLKRKRR